MKKNVSSQSMDAALQDFLGNKPRVWKLRSLNPSLPTRRNSRNTRDALDRIDRMFGGHRMSVSGLMENIARQHLTST